MADNPNEKEIFVNYSNSKTTVMVVYESDMKRVYNILEREHVKNGRQIKPYPKDVLKMLLDERENRPK